MMMYSSIMELPSQVTASLDDKDSEAWMKAYNEAIGEDPSLEDVMAARRTAWYSVREAPSSYSFCAKASVEAIDKQKELITLDSIIKGMDDYIRHGGPMSWDHTSYTIGTVWGWDKIDTPHGAGVQVWGNLYGGDQYIYDLTRKRFGSGATKLSVSGPATKVPTCDMDHGCYVKREMEQLMEIALTPHPVNDYATLVWSSNALGDVKKSESPMLSVYDISIHRSEDACPVMRLKKALCDIGADAHARKGGVFIPSSDPSVVIKGASSAGLAAREYTDDRLGRGAFIESFGDRLEQEFKYSIVNNECDEDGILYKSIPEDRFKDLCRSNLIIQRFGGWGFRPYI